MSTNIEPPAVSGTSFLRFCLADKIQSQDVVVRDTIKMYLEPYNPRFDHWKRFRDGVKRVHRGSGNRAQLDEMREGLPASKVASYNEAIDGYQKWWGRKTITYESDLRSVDWGAHATKIRVNPEMLVVVDGRRLALKLYFSGSRNRVLGRRDADVLLHLMHQTHGDLAQPALLDVRRAKLWEWRESIDEDVLDRALTAQSAAFSSLWAASFPKAA